MLALPSCGLSGVVSGNVTRLASLTLLDLSANAVQLQLHDVLSTLTALRYDRCSDGCVVVLVAVTVDKSACLCEGCTGS